MSAPRLVLLLAGACLLATPLFAQNRSGPGGTQGGQHAGAVTGGTRAMPNNAAATRGVAPRVGGSRGPVEWGSFHHDAAPARISPHRYGTTNLPMPNRFRGNFNNFNTGSWNGGQWRHLSHNGRLGWWWVVGPDWYYYNTPIYPYPDLYTPPGLPFGWWYWCDTYQDYYPYVTTCPVPWESVMARD